MEEISGETPDRDQSRADRAAQDNKHTLGEHYRRKRARYEFDKPDAYDLRLKRMFGKRRKGRGASAPARSCASVGRSWSGC